jgi:hypothetical protein
VSLREYLRDGAAQRRLLTVMADGHARRKHGAELGNPSRDDFQAQVARHLAEAPLGFAVTASGGKRRYLIADPRSNRAAWINPRKEHRSTFFGPTQGVAEYLRRAQEANPAQRWTRVNVARQRGASSRVRSAARSATTGRGLSH